MKWLCSLATFVLLSIAALFGQGTNPPERSVEILANQGWAYFKKGDCLSLSMAEKDFSEAVTLQPENANLHGWLGTVLMDQGAKNLSNCGHSKEEGTNNLEHAWSELRIALNLDSKNVLNRGEFVALSELLKRKPEYNGGIAMEPDKNELSQWLADHPPAASGKPSDSLESLESLADNALNAERNKRLAGTQEDVTDAKEAIRANPTDGLAWGKLGRAYFDLGDYKNAEQATKKAVEIFHERFKNAPPPDLLVAGSNEAFSDLGMLGVHYELLAEISAKLHKRREAARYRDSAIRAFDLQRGLPDPVPQTREPLPQHSPPGGSCTVLIVCSIPLCPTPQYELCDAANGTNQFSNCLARNRQEDGRYQVCQDQGRHEYQQCLDQRRRDCSR
jgi:tetratricopeptide (TPR) repeat protein